MLNPSIMWGPQNQYEFNNFSWVMNYRCLRPWSVLSVDETETTALL